MLGPVVPGATMAGGARVPGTSYELDPVQAAFNIGAMIRWLDFNDTWLAAEWGHPSDNLGGILAVADWQARKAVAEGPLAADGARRPHRHDQGARNPGRAGAREHLQPRRPRSRHPRARRVDRGRHVDARRLAGAGRQCRLQRLDRRRRAPDLSPRAQYRLAQELGGRRCDEPRRAHALIALRGEMGYPSALTAPKWGFYDVLFQGKPLRLTQGFGSYVMENVLFKISFPAEFHAQTAVECAMRLHPEVRDRLDAIERIVIETQEPGVRIIDKTGPLANPADRDHCLQYMIAMPLIHGRLTAADYEDAVAADPRIDALRAKMEVRENPQFTAEYYAADKRFIGNAMQVFFKDGTRTERIQVDTPIGHRRRRQEGYPGARGEIPRLAPARVPGEAAPPDRVAVRRSGQARRDARGRFRRAPRAQLSPQARPVSPRRS